LSVKYSLLTAM